MTESGGWITPILSPRSYPPSPGNTLCNRIGLRAEGKGADLRGGQYPRGIGSQLPAELLSAPAPALRRGGGRRLASGLAVRSFGSLITSSSCASAGRRACWSGDVAQGFPSRRHRGSCDTSERHRSKRSPCVSSSHRNPNAASSTRRRSTWCDSPNPCRAATPRTHSPSHSQYRWRKACSEGLPATLPGWPPRRRRPSRAAAAAISGWVMPEWARNS